MRTILLLLFSVAALSPGANAATISTIFAANNGQAGNMFDVTNLSGADITITGIFGVNLASGATGENLAVYYRPGTYVGFESTAAGWTLLGTDTVDSLGINVATPIDVGAIFGIGAGQTYGLFVTTTGSTSLRYTNGANTYSDGTLQITTGVGKALPLFNGSTFSPRTWNGSIDYAAASTAPEPSTWMLMLGGLAALAAMRRRRE